MWVIMISWASWWDTALLYWYVRLEDEGKDEILVVGEVRIMWLVSTLLTTRKHMMFLKAGLKLIGLLLHKKLTGQVVFFSSQLWHMQVWSFSQSISLCQFRPDSQKPTSLDWGLQSFSLPSNIRRNSVSRNWGSDQKSQSNRKLVLNPHTSSIKKQKLDEIYVFYKL